MPRTKEQFEEIRENRKQQIMEIAMTLFARDGYGHVSISMLANEAGISKGLMYNYFESKEQLLREIIETSMHEISRYFDPNQDGVLTEAEFILFIRKTFQLMKDEREYWMKFFSLIIQPNVLPILKNSSFLISIDRFMGMFNDYFREHDFEDPALEMLNLAVIIEGLGMIMIFYQNVTEIPMDLLEKLENRIIKMYTK